MSKLDAVRAMREAHYDRAPARAAKPPSTPKGTPRAAAKPAAKAPAKAPAMDPAGEPDLPQEQLCGHRAISGRTCTREQGHAAKSHRYS